MWKSINLFVPYYDNIFTQFYKFPKMFCIYNKFENLLSLALGDKEKTKVLQRVYTFVYTIIIGLSKLLCTLFVL